MTNKAIKAMTLEEAIRESRERGYDLTWDGVRWCATTLDGKRVSESPRWAGPASRALDYPVVERDDTAELVEALEAYLSAHDALRDWHEDDEGSYDHFKAQMRGDRTLDDLRAALAKWKAGKE